MTGKRLLARVCPSVSREGAGCSSTVLAPIPLTGKQLLASVCPSVFLEVAGLRSTVHTVLPMTGKRLLARVGASVPRQRIWSRKDLPTRLIIAAVLLVRHGCAARRVRGVDYQTGRDWRAMF